MSASDAAARAAGVERSKTPSGQGSRIPIAVGPNSLKIFCVFFLGGVLLAFAIDAILLGVAVVLDLARYRNFVGQETMGLVTTFPFLVVTAPTAYVASQFISAVLALLSFVVLKRVAFWWVAISVPLVAYRFGFSIFADLCWKSGLIGKQSAPLANFLTVCAIQAVVAMSCWLWLQRSRPGTSSLLEHKREH